MTLILMADSDRSSGAVQVLNRRPLQVLSEITPETAEKPEQNEENTQIEMLAHENLYLRDLPC